MEHIKGRFGFLCCCEVCGKDRSPRNLRKFPKSIDISALDMLFMTTLSPLCHKYHPDTCLKSLSWAYELFENRGMSLEICQEVVRSYSSQWDTSADRIPNFCGEILELWLWARKADATRKVCVMGALVLFAILCFQPGCVILFNRSAHLARERINSLQ
jgi:hypothetical protein